MDKNQSEKSKEWAKFLDLFLGAKDRMTLDMLFQLFMTLNERDMLVDRYRLVKALLTTDLSQREISEILQLSISKVTMGSKATQILPDQHKSYLLKKMK